MERERRDAPVHIEKQVFLAAEIIREKAIDLALVLRHEEAFRERVLGNKNGVLKNKLRKGALKPVRRRRIGRTDNARGCPVDPLAHTVGPLRLAAAFLRKRHSRAQPRAQQQHDTQPGGPVPPFRKPQDPPPFSAAVKL